ncbi:helix-turn-helix domain-containing protein [Sporosarcina limicola]|uniref:Transcriptional regulator with XRE-family HTH domain n=1 Tax=Sporosarcina limicola TaxID=34101 RepID=A0A927MPA4_9BACL|nr:helix-turn-helix transcriptional regulator [Sporosarcina limicola]MBE1554876.1 transcriptional regulator with XRE-family HTH domain [Sporosarcina limicola]
MNVKTMRAIRQLGNLDQIEFAEKVGVSKSLLQKIETGNALLTKRTASKIMYAFRLTEKDIKELADMIEHLKEK